MVKSESTAQPQLTRLYSFPYDFQNESETTINRYRGCEVQSHIQWCLKAKTKRKIKKHTVYVGPTHLFAQDTQPQNVQNMLMHHICSFNATPRARVSKWVDRSVFECFMHVNKNILNLNGLISIERHLSVWLCVSYKTLLFFMCNKAAASTSILSVHFARFFFKWE